MHTLGLISVVGALALAVAAVVAWMPLARRERRTSRVAWAAALIGILANALYLGWAIHDHGVVGTFRQNEEAALLLATLLAATGIGTYLARSLRGLDSLLFLLAAVVDLTALFMTTPAGGAPRYRSWYISHGLSFAISGACLMAAGVAAVAYLIVHGILRRKRALVLVGQVPSLEALDRFTRWMLGIGFPLLTYGMLTGLCGVAHRRDIGRTAWYLDPTVVFSALAWGVYAWLCVRLVLRPGIRGRRLAALATWGMGLLAAAYVFMEFSSPIHR